MGIDNTFLAWERPEEAVELTRLAEIATHETERPSEAHSIIRISRVSTEGASLYVPEEPSLYRLGDARAAWEHHQLEIQTGEGDDRKTYRMARPLLSVALRVKYPNDEPLPTTPEDWNLYPDDENLVEFLFDSQLVAQAEALEESLGIKPRIWVSRENDPRYTAEIQNLDPIAARIRRAQRRIGYKPNPDVTESAIPGRKLGRYSPTQGFATTADDLLERILMLQRILRSAA